MTAAPFNAVLSRYMSDVIYEEKYENILPCYNIGMLLNLILSCALGIPFCIWERVVGGVNLLFVFTGFCGYISLVLVFYSMLYLSICKDYQKISFFFIDGMIFAFLFSVILVKLLHREVVYSMVLSLSCGFFCNSSIRRCDDQKVFQEEQQPIQRSSCVFQKILAACGNQFPVYIGIIYS